MVLLEMTFLKLWRHRPQAAPFFANHDGIGGGGRGVFQTSRSYKHRGIRGEHLAELRGILGGCVAHTPYLVVVVKDILANVDDHGVTHSPRAIQSQPAPSLAFRCGLTGIEEKPDS